VTFGITPAHSETGYGCLEFVALATGDTTFVKEIVEKPTAASA
jgi:mannose-1-phosphate guanylyltransferase